MMLSPIVICSFNSVENMGIPELRKYVGTYKKVLDGDPDNPILNNSIAFCYLKERNVMDYERNKNYFSKLEIKYQIKMIAIGAVILLLGILISFFRFLCLVGLGVIAIGGVIIFLKKRKIMSDDEYRQGVFKHVRELNLKAQALKKLGVDEEEVKEIEPLELYSFEHRGAGYRKITKSNKFVSDYFKVQFLFFSDSEVLYYTYSFFTTQNKMSEETEIYFYNDIVSVSTIEDSFKVDEKNITKRGLSVTTAALNGGLAVFADNVEELEKSANAMRALLREKKRG